MIDETAKRTMLSVAEECDGFAVAMCSIYELAVRAAIRVIDAKLTFRQCRWDSEGWSSLQNSPMVLRKGIRRRNAH
jgi:hypothetical protein